MTVMHMAVSQDVLRGPNRGNLRQSMIVLAQQARDIIRAQITVITRRAQLPYNSVPYLAPPTRHDDRMAAVRRHCGDSMLIK